MKKISLFLIITTLAAVSCGPLPYYIDVEMRRAAEVKFDLSGKRVSIVSVSSSTPGDSTYLSNMSIGMAEQIEKDRGLSSGEVPVYFLTQGQYLSGGLTALYNVAYSTSSDMLIFVDSLNVGDYAANDNVVSLPFRTHYQLIDVSTMSTLFQKTFSNSIKWVFMDEEGIHPLAAISKANATSVKGFKSLGSNMALPLSPQWDSQQRMIVVYDLQMWQYAFDYAKEFQWEKAMEIWMELSKSTNPEKASCAAYNMAVACEMTEQFDLAKKWLDFAQKKYYFREIESMREIIANSEELARFQ